MSLLSNLLSIVRIATKRLWANKGLAFSLLIGWTAAVGLSLSIPLYADAVNRFAPGRLGRLADYGAGGNDNRRWPHCRRRW